MLLDKLVIKGNEIKEPGLFGKTIYVIKGNEIKEPGFLGRTVFVIKGNEIKEPGVFGKTLYVIKGAEIRTPGWFGETVAKTKTDGSIRYNKPEVQKDKHIQESKNNNAEVPIIDTNPEDFETLDELQKRLDLEQGCVVDYTNCSPERKSYSVPRKYSKLTAIAPALRLETVKIHSEVALIVGRNVNVKDAFIVGDKNQYYSSENGILYNKTKTVLVRVPYEYDISSFVIPNTIKVISEYAFFGCTMGEFKIPETIITIGKSAFAHCKKFKSIFIPQTVKTIGENAFEYDNILQITTNAEIKPNGWKIDEMSLKKSIKWGVK